MLFKSSSFVERVVPSTVPDPLHCQSWGPAGAGASSGQIAPSSSGRSGAWASDTRQPSKGLGPCVQRRGRAPAPLRARAVPAAATLLAAWPATERPLQTLWRQRTCNEAALPPPRAQGHRPQSAADKTRRRGEGAQGSAGRALTPGPLWTYSYRPLPTSPSPGGSP